MDGAEMAEPSRQVRPLLRLGTGHEGEGGHAAGRAAIVDLGEPTPVQGRDDARGGHHIFGPQRLDPGQLGADFRRRVIARPVDPQYQVTRAGRGAEGGILGNGHEVQGRVGRHAPFGKMDADDGLDPRQILGVIQHPPGPSH